MALPAILAGVSLGLEVVGAVQKHRAQNEAERTNRRFALDNLRLERRDLGIRSTEEQRSAARQIDQILIDMGIVEGQIGASAATGNVRGQSVRAQALDLRRRSAGQIDAVRDQTQLTLDQLQRLRESASLRAEAQIAQVPGASIFGTGLSIAGAGLNYYSRWKSLPRNQFSGVQPDMFRTPAPLTAVHDFTRDPALPDLRG
jgi:hypothetical protein